MLTQHKSWLPFLPYNFPLLPVELGIEIVDKLAWKKSLAKSWKVKLKRSGVLVSEKN